MIALTLSTVIIMSGHITEGRVVDQHCEHKIEYRLEDKTRVDCLEPAIAWEYDWANKWAECLGQALHYAHMTDRLAGCRLIILNEKKEHKYVERLRNTIKEHRLPVALEPVYVGAEK